MASAFLLLLSTIDRHLSVFFFGAFVPLLFFQQEQIRHLKGPFASMLMPWIALFLWQGIDLLWLSKMGLEKVFLIAFCNSLIFTLPFFARYVFLNRGRPVLANLIWLSSWVALEFLHVQWSLAFPMFQLGNFLAVWPQFIQWYEWTGVFGGSLWILGGNLLILHAFTAEAKQYSIRAVYLATLLLIPIAISFVLEMRFAEGEKTVEVLSLHPNTNCYSEKFVIPQHELIDTYLSYTAEALKPSTRFVIWPETAIPQGPWLSSLTNDPDIQRIRDLLSRFPSTNFITGINTYATLDNPHPALTALNPEVTTIKDPKYLSYNTILHLADQQGIQMRSKSRLVPFEETEALTGILRPLQKWIGSASGKHYSSFRHNPVTQLAKDQRIRTATLICYESAFGGISAEMSRKGADLLFVLLNEGWYDNLRGAQKFLDLSVLRAIETRKSIVRSSNRGISAAISPTGKILSYLDEQETAILQTEVSLNEGVTLYSRLGDWVAYLTILAGLLCFPALLFFHGPPVSKPDTNEL